MQIRMVFVFILIVSILTSYAVLCCYATERDRGAKNPYPANGGDYLVFDGVFEEFTWKPSEDAVEFDVYIGRSPAEVSRADRESTEFIETVQTASYFDKNARFDRMEYYWRVDEIYSDGSIRKGSIWRFTPAEWDSDVFLNYGNETLEFMREKFGRMDGGFFEDTSKTAAAFAWPCSVALLAYSGSARIIREMDNDISSLVGFINRYWSNANGIGGYDCVIDPGITNRFYDDNSWLAWALIEAYMATGNEEILSRAAETFEFVMSGEDETFGGGIWWKETWRAEDGTPMKSVSSTAGGAMVGAMLYRETGDERYKDAAVRILDYLQNVMREGDGQILNDYSEHGIGRWYWSYNTAVPAIAYVELYKASGEPEFLDAAIDLAEVCIGDYFDISQGTIKDEAYFAFTIIEALARLYNETEDKRYLSVINKAVTAVYNGRSENGYFQKRWDDKTRLESDEKSLLITAAAARAFYTTASISIEKDNLRTETSSNILYIALYLSAITIIILLVTGGYVFYKKRSV